MTFVFGLACGALLVAILAHIRINALEEQCRYLYKTAVLDQGYGPDEKDAA